MTRDQQEMALWAAEYSASRLIHAAGRAAEADAAVAEYRKRYPVEPTAPPAVWYDEPPFPKDGESYPCWVDDERCACTVHWRHEWLVVLVGDYHTHRLAGRRVCPITEPPEPTA